MYLLKLAAAVMRKFMEFLSSFQNLLRELGEQFSMEGPRKSRAGERSEAEAATEEVAAH